MLHHKHEDVMATSTQQIQNAAFENAATGGNVLTGSFVTKLTTTGARVVFALPFAVFGLFHFTNANAMAGMVPLPGGVFWVYLTGVALIAGAVGLILKKWGAWAGLGLAALMLSFILGVHLPGLSNPQMAQFAMIGLLKDTALLGASLAFAGILARKEQ